MYLDKRSWKTVLERRKTQTLFQLTINYMLSENIFNYNFAHSPNVNCYQNK